jgi:hypothetical protein
MMADFFEPEGRPVWLASYPRSGNTFLRIILQKVFCLPSYSLYRVEGQDHSDPSAAALEQAPHLPRNWRQLLSNRADGKIIPIKTHDPPEDDAPAIYIIRDGRNRWSVPIRWLERALFVMAPPEPCLRAVASIRSIGCQSNRNHSSAGGFSESPAPSGRSTILFRTKGPFARFFSPRQKH